MAVNSFFEVPQINICAYLYLNEANNQVTLKTFNRKLLVTVPSKTTQHIVREFSEIPPLTF